MNRFVLRALFVMGGVSFLAGCQTSSQDKGPVVAKVGSTVITLSDFKSRLQDTPAAYQQYAATAEGRRQFLNLLLREKVLLENARKAGLQKDDKYREAIARFKKKWERDLKDYQESLLVEMALARLRTHDLTVTDAEARRYYEDHAAEYAHPVEVQASHILVNSPEEAAKVLERLKRHEPFEAVARSASMDPPTAARGGKLSPFTRGSLLPEFENAVFALKDGEVSGIVKTPFGYHIIKKLSQKSLPERSFEQAKDEIQNRLQRDKFDKWVTQEQSSLGVSIDEKALAGLSLEPMSAQPLPRSGASTGRGESVR